VTIQLLYNLAETAAATVGIFTVIKVVILPVTKWIGRKIKGYWSNLTGNSNQQKQIDIIAITQNTHNATISTVEQVAKFIIDHTIEKPLFLCDASGLCVWANIGFCKMLGVGLKEALGWGWVSYLHKDDRERVYHQWVEVMTHPRPFHSSHRFVSSFEELHEVVAFAQPIYTNGVVTSWIGMVKILPNDEVSA